MKIHETFDDSGALDTVSLVVLDDNGALAIESREGIFVLPEGALAAVMSRYGAPLDEAERIDRVASLRIDDETSVHHIRHLAIYDVIARDFLVYKDAATSTELCALATTVAAALHHLARANA